MTGYWYMRNEITIHVKPGATLTSTIVMVINTQFPQLRHNYRILYSDPGVCVSCIRPSSPSAIDESGLTWRSERGEPVLTPSDEEIIYPGKEISCGPLGSNYAKFGTFSGKICGYGIAAGHIASSGSEMEHASSICFESQVIGIPLLAIRYVRVPIQGTRSTRKTLGDLLFFVLNNQDSVNNIFYGDPLDSGGKENFNIVLHRGPIRENDQVMVILRDEKVKYGRIASIDFNLDTAKHTLYIVDEHNRALTADGDSGAIVVLRPNPGDRNLKAIGVVAQLHYIPKPEYIGTNYTEPNAENSISLGTIAIRLYDVLVAVQQCSMLGDPREFRKIDLGPSPQWIEFSGPQATREQFDSGIQAGSRSLEDPETSGI